MTQEICAAPNTIEKISDVEIAMVDGGILPALAVVYFAGGVLTGSGIYLATEYLT